MISKKLLKLFIVGSLLLASMGFAPQALDGCPRGYAESDRVSLRYDGIRFDAGKSSDHECQPDLPGTGTGAPRCNHLREWRL